MNEKNESIEKLLKSYESKKEAPPFLENEIMQGVETVERNNRFTLNINRVFLFAGLLSALVLVSIVLQYYLPYVQWLVNAKLVLAAAVAILALYQVVSWLPDLLGRFFGRTR